MTFKEFYYAIPVSDRAAFAKQVGKSVGFLNFVAGGRRNAGAELALLVEHLSGGAVSVGEMRPELAEVLKRAGYVRCPSP